jgi:hypothetical protein
MCVDYKLPVWFNWRKDKDYFDRMQIFSENILLQPKMAAT